MLSHLVQIVKAVREPENQYCALMLPVWIANADNLIKSRTEDYDADRVLGVRLKYILNHMYPALHHAEALKTSKKDFLYNAESYNRFIELVNPYLFKEGDCFEIVKVVPGTFEEKASVYKFIKIDLSDFQNMIVVLDDGKCDDVQMPVKSFRKLYIRKISEPENFDLQRKERVRLLNDLPNRNITEKRGVSRRKIFFV